jgi:hypothetical protein
MGMSILLSAVLATGICVSCLPAAERFAGCRPAGPEEAALFARSVRERPVAPPVAELPSSWQNIRHLPVVGWQTLQNCGAYAPTYYYKTYQEARERGWARPDPSIHPERIMSPGFTFPLVNGGQNDGASIWQTMEVMCRYGCATWADKPETYQYWEYPADDVWVRALPYRADHVFGIGLDTDAGLDDLKAHLVSGDIAVFSMLLHYDVWQHYPGGGSTDNGVIHGNGTNLWDFHALTIVGYDDNRSYFDGATQRSGALLCVNSWGAGWGVNVTEAESAGFCWIGYEHVKNTRGGLAGGAYCMADRINYVPRETAEISIQHARRDELRLRIYGGRHPGGAPPLYTEAFPHHGGPHPYDGTITLDITDFIDEDPVFYRLDGFDYGDASLGFTEYVPTIHEFVVHKEAGYDLRCRGVPVTFPHSPTFTEQLPVTLQAGLLQPGTVYLGGLNMEQVAAAWADVDRDGDPDLAVCGSQGGEYVTDVLLNNGSGHFMRMNATLPELNHAAVVWADVDRDLYPDLLLTGTESGTPAAYLYRNAGGHTLEDVGWTLPQSWTGYAFGDYDRDGDLDLARSDGIVLRNDNLTFVDSGLRLSVGSPGWHRTVSWVDVDLDGLPDLQVQVALHRNLGDGTFEKLTDLGSHPTEYSRWSDLTGNGLPDVESGGQWYKNFGWRWSYGGGGALDYWRLNVVSQGYLVWDPAFVKKDAIDMDGDGDLDYAITGSTTDSSAQEDLMGRVYRQLPDSSFSELGIDLEGVIQGFTSWCDWDGDGDADLMLLGNGGTGGDPNTSYLPVMAAYKNHLTDDANFPNQRPGVPTDLRVVLDGGRVDLQWNPSTDAETPVCRIEYDVRVGTRPGAGDVVSPPDAFSAFGNAGWIDSGEFPPNPNYATTYLPTNGIPSIRLHGLPDGRYFWSVRSVDGMRARSDWSAEQVMVLDGGILRDGDVNGDGVIDIADLVRLRGMADGTVPPDASRADLNGDGAVGDSDVLILLQTLIDVGAEGFVPLKTLTVGPAGGTLSQAAFSLQVPAGALAADTEITLLASPLAAWFGESSPPVMYQVEGLPEGFDADLTIRVPDQRSSPTNAPTVAFGQWTGGYDVNPATGESRWCYELLVGTVVAGNAIEVVIPSERIVSGASGGGAAVAGPERRAATIPPPTRTGWTFQVGGLSSSPAAFGPHFTIYWSGVAPAELAALATELEDAFTTFHSLGYDFVTNRNWNTYPIQVTLRDISENGAEIHSSDNGAYIELNPRIMPNDELRSATAGHEVFHLVQGLQNPAYSVTEARDSQLLLVNEAASTWSEKLFVLDSDYVPETYVQQRPLVFLGPDVSHHDNATWAGYGFSCLLEFYDLNYGHEAVRRIYENLQAGKGALDALLDAPDQPDFSWWPDFYEALVRGEIYDSWPLIIVPTGKTRNPEWPDDDGKRLFRAKAELDALGKAFTIPLTNLSADGARFAFDSAFVPHIKDESAFVVSVSNPNQDLNLRVVSATRLVDPEETAPYELYGASPATLRARVPDLKTLVTVPADLKRYNIRSFIPLLVRNSRTPGQGQASTTHTLRMGIAEILDGVRPAQSIDFDGAFPIYVNNMWAYPVLASITGQGVIQVSDLTAREDLGTLNLTTGDIPMSRYWVWQDGTVTLNMTVSGLNMIPKPPVEISAGSETYRVSIKQVKDTVYSRRRMLGDYSQPFDFYRSPFSGTVSVELWVTDEPHAIIFYDVEMLCDIQIEQLDGPGGSVLTSWDAEDQGIYVFTVFLTRQ